MVILFCQPIEFDVHEFEEDQINLLAVEDYPPLPGAINGSIPWQISTFALPGTTPEPLPAWAELLELPPTPELVEKGVWWSTTTSSPMQRIHPALA